MAMADASWWGDEEEFDNDIQARLKSGDSAVRSEAQKLLIARNARSKQGRNPFQSPAAVPADAPEAPPAGRQTADQYASLPRSQYVERGVRGLASGSGRELPSSSPSGDDRPDHGCHPGRERLSGGPAARAGADGP